MFDINSAFNKAGELLQQGKYEDVFPVCDEIIRNGYDIPEVYLLRLLAEANKNDIRELANSDIPLQDCQSFQKAVSLADSEMSNYLEQCNENSLLNCNKKREQATKSQKSNTTNVIKGTMRAITCELCGSNEIIKDEGFFVCQHCGTKYTLEEARKMMIEGRVDVSGSTVHIDTSNELENLYELARRAHNEHNDENAAKYYEMILLKDPMSWEATFYSTYYKARKCKIAEIGTMAKNILHCLSTVMALIRDRVQGRDNQIKAITEVMEKCIDISQMLYDASEAHYYNIDAIIRNKFTTEYILNRVTASAAVSNCADEIVKNFPNDNEIGQIACIGWKKKIEMANEIYALIDEADYLNVIKEEVENIRIYEPEYQPPKKKTKADLTEKVTKEYGGGESKAADAYAIYIIISIIGGIIFLISMMSI